MISFQNLSYHIAGRQILNNINFQISSNQHIGLVGRNGTGKSTIFKLIQGELSPDQGSKNVAKSWKILSIKQEMPEGALTPLEFLLTQDEERLRLLTELDNCQELEKMADIYDRLLQIDAYSAEARAAKVLKGLGFDEEAQHRPLSTFSGGFRMRVALAAVLFQEPDLLLLDEPTNHLDLETTQWLEDFLKKYSKSFILISHERDFLNKTVDYIFHLKNSQLNRYTGNFDTFLETYQLQQSNIAAYNSKLAEQRNHMMEFVNRNRAKASKAKQAQSRLKAIEKLNFIPVEKNDPTVAFKFPEPEKLPPPLLTFEKITLGYQNKIVLKNIKGAISPEDRIALVGANGNGKTTFARFLAGELSPQAGEMNASSKLRIGFYKQDQFEALDINKTPYSLIGELAKNFNDLQIRTHLGGFGFEREKAMQKIKELSGGERARLLFACLTIQHPNLLILDEPTNHLDMEMRESLITSLNSYPGAVVLISHDRHLLQYVADRLMIVKDGKITSFEGDIKEYI